MTMWKFAFILFTLIPSLSGAREWLLRSSLEYDASLAPVISFELTYHGVLDRTVFESDLPWGIRDSLTLAVFTIDDLPIKFNALLYPDDPKTTQIVVRTGQTLRGKVLLRQRLDLSSLAMTSAPVAVCWTYDSAKLVRGGPDMFTDCSVIPKRNRKPA